MYVYGPSSPANYPASVWVPLRRSAVGVCGRCFTSPYLPRRRVFFSSPGWRWEIRPPLGDPSSEVRLWLVHTRFASTLRPRVCPCVWVPAVICANIFRIAVDGTGDVTSPVCNPVVVPRVSPDTAEAVDFLHPVQVNLRTSSRQHV